MRKKIELITLTLLIFLCVILRLYRVNNPIGDWHAFRQADTSAVSKVFVLNGVDILHPKYFDISNIQSGKDNPQGYRFVEFPIYNLLQALAYSLIGYFTLEQWGRLISIFSSTLSLIFIYLIVRKYLDVISAFFSALFFAVLPFSIYYGRVILPDPSTAMTILGGIYFFSKWAEQSSNINIKNSKSTYALFALSILFTASSFLIKPFALFFTVPFLYLSYKYFGLSFIKKWQLYLFALISVLPLIVWRIWIAQFPAGIPVSAWLFNEGNIRFTGAYFNWIFAERVSKLILGYFAVSLLILGFFKRDEKNYGLFITFLISSLLYIVIIARGNVQHDYYQILIMPTICMFLGRGASFLLKLPLLLGKNLLFNTYLSILMIVVIIIFSFMFSWYHIRDYFNINNRGLIKAGQIANNLLPKNAKVIAPNNGDTSFLYYISRKGWPAYEKSPIELREMGATHIVISNPTENDYKGLGSEFKVFYSSPEVLILKL